MAHLSHKITPTIRIGEDKLPTRQLVLWEIARSAGKRERRLQMDVREKIDGAAPADDPIRDQDWPSRDKLSDFVWPDGVALRGSVRLAGGLLTDREIISAKWKSVKQAILKRL